MRTDEAMAVEDLHAELHAEICALRTELSLTQAVKIAQTAKIETDAKVIAEKDAEIARLDSAFDDCAENANASQAEVERQEKVIAALRGAFLAHLMRENECYCFQNGVPCDAKKCGCLMELQAAVDEQTAGESK